MINPILTIIQQMGGRYVAFRAWHELRKRTGLLRLAFPTSIALTPTPSLDAWKRDKPKFFVKEKGTNSVQKRPNHQLQKWYQRFCKGEFQFFDYEWKAIGRDYDWLTNPTTGYSYALDHWTQIPDLDSEKGDVKYVWEKSRFSYLLKLIRYDYHFEEDLSELVFTEIDNWLDANPLNLGPNYLCSQEISLRLLNWVFALYYYQNSEALTQVRWQRIMQSVYGQLRHVRANIHFSRIAVRNNHAVTETLMLYVGGLLFPWFPEAAEWKRRGKAWFEQEVTYQVYDDGTYIQHSHNYQRVLTQLLSYAMAVAMANGESFAPAIRARALASTRYLFDCTNVVSGELPNYGSNDGALFFPLATQRYRDYRPQLNGLCCLLNGSLCFPGIADEEAEWLSQGLASGIPPDRIPLSKRGDHAFSTKGIFIYRSPNSFTFLNCGSYRDRPFHADNLHLDVWINGTNVLRDAGTYRYNTASQKLNFFSGTAGHNTVMLGSHNQMKKAGRFIWLNWSMAVETEFKPTSDGFRFKGEIIAFAHLGKNIRHQREVVHTASSDKWVITDKVMHQTTFPVVQHWNLHPEWEKFIHFEASDGNGQSITPQLTTAWFSGHYGELSSAPHLTFTTSGDFIRTTITKLNQPG